MRSSRTLLLSCVFLLGLAGCSARTAEPGGDSGYPTTGAHTQHIIGTIAKPIACSQCHNGQFQVTLEGRLARANDAVGTFNTQDLTCSNVYCHAGGPGLVIGGGTTMTPKWNPPSRLDCNSCHGTPGGGAPTTWHPTVAAGVECVLCHPGYTNWTANKEIHVNGVADLFPPTLGTSCAACHGDPTRVVPVGLELAQAAPPRDRFGGSSTDLPSVGAHQAHVNPPAGAIARAISCDECHFTTSTSGPNRLAHVGPTPTTEVIPAWGPTAVADHATPSYDRSTVTCTNYCHGQTLSAVGAAGTNTTPVWTRVDGTQAACGTCHGSPPGDQVHYLHASPAAVGLACEKCHPTGYTVGAVGSSAVGFHVNGVVDMNLTNPVPDFRDWKATDANANGWTGTATGCHDRGRYWRPGRSGTTCW